MFNNLEITGIAFSEYTIRLVDRLDSLHDRVGQVVQIVGVHAAHADSARFGEVHVVLLHEMLALRF